MALAGSLLQAYLAALLDSQDASHSWAEDWTSGSRGWVLHSVLGRLVRLAPLRWSRDVVEPPDIFVNRRSDLVWQAQSADPRLQAIETLGQD